MFAFAFLLAGINTPPASVPPRASDHKALMRGDIVKRMEPVAGAAVPRMRAYALIDAPPAQVFALIDRCDNYHRVMPRTSYSKELSRDGNTVVCKIKIELPMFLGTLVSVTRGHHTVGPPKWGRAWSLVSGTFKHNAGRWVISAYKGNPNLSLIEYCIHAVPDLSLPDMVLRKANGRGIPGLLRGLRKRLTGKETR